MLFRDITEMNSTMVIGHGVITFRIGVLADEFKCRARSKVFIGIPAAITPAGDLWLSSAIQLGYDRTLSSPSRAKPSAV